MQARHCRMVSAVCISNIICLTSRWICSTALSESRRFFLRSLSLRSLASAVSQRRQFFVACEDCACAARLALSLPRRLDNRVSSSSALSEARQRLTSVVVTMLQFYARVVVELELRYVQRQRPKSAAAAAHTVIPIQRQHAHKIATSDAKKGVANRIRKNIFRETLQIGKLFASKCWRYTVCTYVRIYRHGEGTLSELKEECRCFYMVSCHTKEKS